MTDESELVDKRCEHTINDASFTEEESFTNKVDARSREIRICIVSIILIVWALLMIPYDINGSIIHGDYVRDRNMFLSALYIWLIGHLSVILSSFVSIITIKYCINKEWVINIQLLLIFSGSCLQVLGSIFYAYSYCVNLTDSNDDKLWASCVSKCHGLYLLFNSGFITYLGFIIFANKFNGRIPIVSIFVCKDCWKDDDDNPCKFTKNFRISFLAIFSLMGMILILVFGFDIYITLSPEYQAIYIGYTFLLFGTFLVIVIQILFHWRCWFCRKNKKAHKINTYDIHSNIVTDANISASDIKIQTQKQEQNWLHSIESVLNLAVYFLVFAGIVMIFMYSLVSKIPEAPNMIERVRLIGNMIIITGTGLVMCYELFSRQDNYDDKRIDHQYNIINDQEL
eukprot:281690_1